MKNFIIGFIISVFCIAFAVGQCNGSDDESNIETASSYSDNSEPETEVKESAKEEIVEKEANDIDLSNDVQLLSHIPSQLLYRKAYTTSYNKNTRCPNWVAWHLTAEHADGDIGRSNRFYEDEEVPEPRATLEDYRHSGWSRGHMCPAGDNKWDEEAMVQSFSLVNVCPQNGSLNSGLWNSVETDCRNWAKRYQDIYIVCGPVFYKQEHETIGENEVVVPEAFFKVVLCLNGTPKGIGIVVKNNSGTKKRDLYYNSIDQVERITGMDFFSSLPDDIENAVEAKADISQW